MKKLKDLGDNKPFTITKNRCSTVYVLNSLDRKTKKATYTSEKSGKTFTKNWNLEVYPL